MIGTKPLYPDPPAVYRVAVPLIDGGVLAAISALDDATFDRAKAEAIAADLRLEPALESLPIFVAEFKLEGEKLQ